MRWALIAVIAGLAGCANNSLANFQQPKIGLDGVTVKGLGFTGGSLDALLGVNNPNRFDIRGTKLDMDLDIGGVKFGPLHFDQVFALPQGATTPVTLPVIFKWSDVGSAARSVLGYGSAPYTITGKIFVTTPAGDQGVPFTQKGTVTLSQLRPGQGTTPP
jgi:LEA14-like dessication related protein